ncbi:chemotaxis protein [Bremerella cremea]|uniref:Chemotaxis protein n=1 Tax=Blastopirellula marina TaxID=124 RepID=A0A2S8FPT2_9BACT|nr:MULTISPECIES: chemotaxis protein [Pirellulaceae]PQO34168.1 chemotaxis protein [Blastopirellula marina]RCS46664.1 chemotaxis protein [Bremerella cremea]
MDTATTNSVDRLQVLHNILSEATEEASSAMSIWTGGAITLSLDCVRELPLEQVTQEFDLGMELLTMVVLTIGGDVGGTFILTFDEENGRRLAASLMKQEVSTEIEWSELEESALKETGNILGCAYFNRIARLIGGEFVPSPPAFLQDYGVCVLQQALMEQVQEGSDVLICQTTFMQGREKLNWNILFVPHTHMRGLLRTSL